MDKEQQVGSEAVLSCTVTGLTRVLDNVTWTNSDDVEITSGGAGGFTINDGSANFTGDTQTTTLTVPGSQTYQNRTYKCIITSDEHGVTNKNATVHLKVFGKLINFHIKSRDCMINVIF